MTLTATARYRTAFLRVVGIDHVDVPATAEVMKGGVNIELALVLDTTSSMSSSDMASLKTAAKTLAETVINGDQSGYSTRVAVVPYSYGVNLGTMASDARGAVTSGYLHIARMQLLLIHQIERIIGILRDHRLCHRADRLRCLYGCIRDNRPRWPPVCSEFRVLPVNQRDPPADL